MSKGKLASASGLINHLEKFGYVMDDVERRAMGGKAFEELETARRIGQVSDRTAAQLEKLIINLVENPRKANHSPCITVAANQTTAASQQSR